MKTLEERLRKFRDTRDWDKFHNPKDLAVSISVEAAELLEVFQWRSEGAPIDDEVKKALESEVADVFSYLILLCDKTGIDLIEATHEKIDRNEKRFPAASSRGVAKPEEKL
ncbi:nucleotide pyrophosphohydrolase [Phaeobacter gallaeciensis]|uniref:nucleotide pyrophosphohydrolase n=1 Tax=Phaeobacter gallaeciensis TaxID=60890 RepID=UPI00237F6A8E|nr:nucleotide pyrophosphohydrolase [Phaeobacter gallaeciensis]MDE4142664.1 nucleotide pyrophosphohydrolase [Phaeobacter gallaeciensis]MDE4151109.1 nucleotide pyrophosphohydrolase [Phaeobacter gallaeciensis]MDE4155338.1 nucleotide pyrophosphohydrolase [Phaeobacter gallaeciensis]MDE4230728.1 nucleotide pyrophosphohydrolase [Phaeobacter gallaeciensis]MDE4259805.1 nucleotide pyrophosphohydrolase [Phaeobacter gallaeciensis]